MNHRLCVTAILVLVFISGQILFAASAPSAAAVTVVVLGSSTAAGAGPSNANNAWVNRYRAALLNAEPGSQVINLAVGGYTTYQIMPDGFTPPAGRPAPDPNSNITKALTFTPDWIIINLPSNDVASGYSVNEQLSNYDAVVALAASQNVPVWISTSQPRNLSGPGRRNLFAMRDSTLARFGQLAINFFDRLALSNGEIQPGYDSGDGVHLNDAGHEILFLLARRATLTLPGGTESTTTKPSSGNALTPAVEEFALLQNYPNPFNPATTIEYNVTSGGFVKLAVYNALGQVVQTLVNGDVPAGRHQVSWHGVDDSGREVGSGLYFYRLQAGDFMEIRRLVLLR